MIIIKIDNVGVRLKLANFNSNERMGPNLELALDSETPPPNTSKIGHFNFFHKKFPRGIFFQNIF
jgi:hypothetical protein